MSDRINVNTVLSWHKDRSRKIKPISDIASLLNNSRSDFLAALRAYVDYAISETGNHEDYQIHHCQHLVEDNSPFSSLLKDAYRFSFGDEKFDQDAMSIDVLSMFVEDQDDDNLIERFVWHFLIALRGSDMRDEPSDLHENFEDIISEQFIVLINQLREE